MTLDIDHGEVTAVIGQKHSGKSVLMERLFCEMDRFVLLDPNHEHGPPDSAAVERYQDVWTHWMDGQTQQVVRDRRGALINDRMEEWVRAAAQLQDCYLGIDEAHKFMNANSCPDVLRTLVKHVVSHQNVGFIFGVHMAKDIPSDVWSQIDNFVIFSYGDKWDAKMQDTSIPYKKVVKDGYGASAAGMADETTIPEPELRDGLDPKSYRFLTYKDGLDGTSTVEGPVPIPAHLH